MFTYLCKKTQVQWDSLGLPAVAFSITEFWRLYFVHQFELKSYFGLRKRGREKSGFNLL